MSGGQTAGWIKMPLGTEVNIGPGNVVLDGVARRSSRLKGAEPPVFRPMSIVHGQTAGWMKFDVRHLVRK